MLFHLGISIEKDFVLNSILYQYVDYDLKLHALGC